jgi:opacity protein-like surface antigen
MRMRKIFWLAVLALGASMAAQAQDYPKAEVFGGYSYAHTSIVGTGFNFNGGIGSLTGNLNDWFGVEGEFAGYHTGSNGVSGTLVTYMFGPRIAVRNKGNDKVTPYFHALFGGAHVSASAFGIGGSDNAFALAVGGGVDARVTKNVAVRVVQADYMLTKFTDGVNDRQNSVRISAGIVFRWGGQ